MSSLKIKVIRLIGNYSANCNFKIKIEVSTSSNKESVQNKHSFKYKVGSSEIIMNELLEIILNEPLTNQSKLQFFLEIYTKTGYRPCAKGVLSISEITPNKPIQIELQKCPLGKGSVEVEFEKFDLLGSNDNPDNNNNSLPINSTISNSSNKPAQPIDNTNDLDSNNNNKKSNINYNNSKSNSNTNNNSNSTNEIIREKDAQINELKTKVEYFEEENNELKGLINDFKKEKKKLMEEKNNLLAQHKEELQKIKNEKEDAQMELASLQQNMNLLQNNKTNTEREVLSMKTQTDKQIKDLMQQVKNLNNIKSQLENENKLKEEKIINLERKNKEMSVNYQKKINEMGNNFSSERNDVLTNHNEKLKLKEEEIVKLNIKINSLEENIQSLNEVIEMTKKENKIKGDSGTQNMEKLLQQISEKDKKIFNLQKELNELNNKINNDLDNKSTQNMLSTINEKELKARVNELQNLITEKDNEINDLRTKYDTLKYESSKLQGKQIYANEEEEFDDGNNEMFINQIKEIQRTYKDREEKLIREKNEEIRKLKMRNQDLIRESVLENNSGVDINKYINEINRLNNTNKSLKEELGYYKELNSTFVDSEKKSMAYESENVKLKNLLQDKNNELDLMQKKQKELVEQKDSFENLLVTSKGKIGELLNDLAEAESKCVLLEEENKKLKGTHNIATSAGRNIMDKIRKIKGKNSKK